MPSVRLGWRRLAPVLFAALGLACGVRGGRGPFPGAPVVLISVDTLRADHLPAYGYSRVKTPHLDALAKDSILFENAYSHCPLTLPSHLSILTGLLPPEHGVRNNLGYRFDGSQHPTLAKVLKGRGYATGGAVSAYVLRSQTGVSDSMDFFDDAVGTLTGGGQDVSLVERPGKETAARALEWVEKVKDRSFFLFLHLYEPHAPYEPPEPFRSEYGATYDGEIAASDAIVGDFLAGLKQKGLYDRAIVLFLSDHGEGLKDHGEGEHGILLYREVLHVPLLLKLPRSAGAGSRVQAPVGLIDVVPTVEALLQIEPPSPLRGKSLVDPASVPGNRSVYSETYYPRIHFGWSELRSLVDERGHYIQGPKPELYALPQDLQERENVLSKNSADAERLQAQLRTYDAHFSNPGSVDAEAAEKLRALGYLSGTSPDVEAKGARPNPKDQLPVYDDLMAAFALTRQGKDREALDALTRVLQKDPGCFDAQREVGGALARLGRFPEAAKAYEKAMALSPQLATAVALSLGQVDVDMGRFPEAEALGRKALAEDPGHAHLLLSHVALARNDLPGAEREALAAIQQTGEPSATMALAWVYLKRSDPAQALAALEKVPAPTAGHNRGPGFAAMLGDVLARLNRYPEAEAAFREEIRFFPKNTYPYVNLAVLLALQGHSREEVHGLLDSMTHADPTRETVLKAVKVLEFLGDPDGVQTFRDKLGHLAPG